MSYNHLDEAAEEAGGVQGRGPAGAQRQAIGVAGGAAFGLLVGITLGFRMNAGATRVERRMQSFRDAWHIVRN